MDITITLGQTQATRTRKTHKPRKTPPPPTYCDICPQKLTNYFVRGLTHHGLHKTMCVSCHQEHGAGLGATQGTLYQMKGEDVARVW